MRVPGIQREQPRDRFLWPSWLTSAVFHAAMLVALGLTFERYPQLPGDSLAATTTSLAFSDQDSQATLDTLAGAEANVTVLSETPASDSQQPSEAPAEDALAAVPKLELPAVPLPAAAPGDTSLDLEPTPEGGGGVPPPGAARRGGARALSSILGKTRTGVFGIRAEGNKFVYVFDRSASMSLHNGAPLAAAKAQLLGSLRDLQRTNQFQIIFYNDRISLFDGTGRLVFGTDDQRLLADRYVRSISADGATRHEEALTAALRMGPDVIFFLTDADHPQLSEAQLARLERLNSGVAQIHTIEFGFGPSYGPRNFLQKLAELNRGEYVYVDVLKLLAPQP